MYLKMDIEQQIKMWSKNINKCSLIGSNLWSSGDGGKRKKTITKKQIATMS